MNIVKWHNDTPLTTSTAIWPSCLASHLYLEALLRPKYLSITAFHCYIFGYNIQRSTFPKPLIPFSTTLLPLPWDNITPHCEG
jgi:hypothetical protein